MWSLYAVSSIAVLIFMVLFFLVAQIIKDNSIIDIGWGIGFVIVAFVSFFHSKGYDSRQLLVLIMVVIWGTRLALHLYIRSIGRGEDFRYANFRKDWGKNAFIIAFFRVFMMQGVIMLLLSYPLLRVNAVQSSGLDVWAVIGLVVWCVGFLFQAIGDYQLEHFKKTRTNKDAILKTGLWRFTRHPNYFGEAAMWWGIFLVVLPVHLGWTAVFSALFINLLLLKVSGVPFLDKRYAGNEAYQTYKQETNLFIPWFPAAKKAKSL
ncbi:DUF1295 domain-containing protein [Paenibacillus psychroresistens]|nr:DUF1295 domain-containing protein [Paenibacillus psychroresistens]